MAEEVVDQETSESVLVNSNGEEISSHEENPVDNTEEIEGTEDTAEEVTGETEEERERIRERRRQERQDKKKYRQEKEDSYKREIDGLRRQLAEVNEWKNTVEHRRVQAGIGQLDKSIKDATEAIEVAKQAIREATETQNGAALVDAQELYYAARKRAEDLSKLRQSFNQRAQQRPQQNIDPMVVKQAQGWMKNKEWYDPSGQDSDSRVVLTLDNALAEEGWDPRTPEYWTELDERVKKYLPHRASEVYTSTTRSRKSITGGSGQSGSSSIPQGSYRLSPERVRAMKEAGMWDDPEKRKNMIKRYMDLDKTNR